MSRAGAQAARKRAIVQQAAARRQIAALPSAASPDDVERYVRTVEGMLSARNRVIARLSEHLTREEKLELGWPRSTA